MFEIHPDSFNSGKWDTFLVSKHLTYNMLHLTNAFGQFKDFCYFEDTTVIEKEEL